MSIESGFGKSNISPPPDGGGMDLRILSYWYDRAGRWGYVRDPLCARAMTFRTRGETACLVALDLIGDTVGLAARIRERIEAALGLPPERIMVVSTHAHTTPETIGLTGHPVDERWLEYVCDRAAEAVGQAVTNLTPCEIFTGQRRLANVAFNRAARSDAEAMKRLSDAERERYAMLDETVRAAALRRGDGAVQAVLWSFACHPVCVQVQPYLSADWPGAALRRLETRYPALFVNGACGDADPVRLRSYEAAEWVGNEVAGAVEDIVSGADTAHAAGEVTIRTARRRLSLARRDVGSVEALEREEREILGAIEAAGEANPKGALHERLFDLREKLALARMPKVLAGEVQAMAIGPIILVGLPGEVVACLGDDIRKAYPGRAVWTVGYANGYLGYLVTRAAHEVGGYEASPGRWSPLAPGEAERIRDEAVGLVGEIMGEDGR